ncbi:helicase-exonuclease AddAB subunit AddA [Dendrosporobacter sp. 1207_IL3150]|uniref:helicase-exonuclease AddAB subunit AddA n=1 Tax=Dendrosporobacter sp. 1207_IL3150 TaxID=3084054 RepID=UPI002FDB22FC
MSWSSEQLQAIETRGKNILVAAAAGSGKTSVLVERIIRRLMDESQPVDVDRLLVVTFTNAAAAEMRERIAAALSSALKERPKSKHLERQLVLLNSASICTIHAFCQNIIRHNFHLLDLDPNFRIANEAEANLIKNDVLEGMFEEKYASGDEAFLKFIEHYGEDHDDQALYSLVLGLYNFSRSHPWPEKWLNDLQNAFSLPDTLNIDQTPWSGLIREKITIELEQSIQLIDSLIRLAALPGNPSEYIEVLGSDRVIVEDIISAASSWRRLGEALGEAKFAKLPSVKGLDESVKKIFQKGRKTVKDKISDSMKLFFDRPETELLEDLRVTAPLIATLGNIINDFSEAFTKAKLAKGLVDFNDLEHFCLQILLADKGKSGSLEPSDTAKALQRKYAEIMVDEYQDTNGVQETMLSLVANSEQPNLFLVGDVKQSIYRFRLAEPELFLAKYREYPMRTEGHVRVDLARNFRSRASVLASVNYLFSQLMTLRAAEMEYGEAERLNPGPDYPATHSKTFNEAVELCLIESDSEDTADIECDSDENEQEVPDDNDECSGFELEARLIAEKINELMSGGYVIFDKSQKGYRNLAWRDIVILMRSVKNKASILLEVLRQANIPAYAEIDSGYFREIEVQVMLSVLSIIDNPRQDIHLAGVLRSPIVGLSAEELANLRVIEPNGDLWTAVTANCEYSETEQSDFRRKIADFVAQLRQWRSFSRRKGVPDLIWQIYRDTGYYDYVGGMSGGILRQANLRALYDRARQYEATNFRGLFRFLRFIERMKDKGTDLAVARALGESEDVVRVMSIHKSKGLEFPVVFVADLGKNINLSDSKSLILMHKKLGVGPYVTNPEQRFRYPTLARHGIAYKLNMETKAEELRILYVALTRAREKLILIGSAKKLKEKAAAWCQTVSHTKMVLPDSLIAWAKSYLDWLCPAVARHADGEALREYGEGCQPLSELLPQDTSRWEVRIYQRGQLTINNSESAGALPFLAEIRSLQPIEAGDGTTWLDKVLEWQYSHSFAVGKPAKLSVSEIKRRFEIMDSSDGEPLFKRPSIIARPHFIQAAGKLTAAEYGTIMHTVMQHIDLKGDLASDGLVKQVQAMILREVLTSEQAAVVDIKGIQQFFTSELGQRMCGASRVRRELPFSLLLPAERFYPDLSGAEEGIFIQGVIDVLFDDGDGLILVDYKTDKVNSGSELADKYAIQISLYAEAIEAIYKMPVKERYLYVFSTGEVIKV